MEKNKKIKVEKKWLIAGAILVVVVLLFLFKNNFIAMSKGVDVKYIDDPLYCEQDSDCAQGATCSPVNIFNYEKQHCERNICGISCVSNQCRYNDCEAIK